MGESNVRSRLPPDLHSSSATQSPTQANSYSSRSSYNTPNESVHRRSSNATDAHSIQRRVSIESRLSNSAPNSPSRPSSLVNKNSSSTPRTTSRSSPDFSFVENKFSPLEASVRDIRNRCGDTKKPTPSSQPPPFDIPDWVDRISQDSKDELHEGNPSYKELYERLRIAETKNETLQNQLNQWQMAASEALNAIALSPMMNERYKQRVDEQLRKILGKIEQVEKVNYINCSFPAVSTQAPMIKMVRWDSLDKSLWEVGWEPSWSVEVSLGGRHYVPFTLSLRVSNIRVKGQLSLTLLSSLHYFWVSFNKDIEFDMTIEVDLLVGLLSVPLQATVEELVRKGFNEWLRNSLVEPNRMRIPLMLKKDEVPDVGISEEDVQNAKLAAQAAMQRASMT